MTQKNFRNGNGVLDITHSASGKEADTLRATIRWNSTREKSALSKGRTSDAQRFAENRAKCQLSLVKLAQSQAA